MNVGFVGLGKLGTPVATCLGLKHRVVGVENNPEIANLILRKGKYPHRELGPTLKDDFQEHFERANVTVANSVTEMMAECKLVFVAVQTPHDPRFEGVTRLPEERADFDYRFLVEACAEVGKHATADHIVVVISTVLPGTMRREVLPVIGKAKLVYSPLFVAMGTVMKDYMNPEFVLLGGDDGDAMDLVEDVYRNLIHRTETHDTGTSVGLITKYVPTKFCCMSIESAELTKVAYNVAIGQKIHLANTLMEICHKIPCCNVDDVTNTLGKATDRLVSMRYTKGGSEDSGGCHPRDAIALSWLARKYLSYDPFGDLMGYREARTEWYADLIIQHRHEVENGEIVVLGKAYKPETNLTTGSHATLLVNVLRERGLRVDHYDPYIDGSIWVAEVEPSRVYFIATKHEAFAKWPFPRGSVVLDPFRFIKPQEGVKVIPIGIGAKG